MDQSAGHASEPGGDVYVANSGSGTMSVINTVTATITVGAGPQDVTVSPIGPAAGDVYVTNLASNTVSVIR